MRTFLRTLAYPIACAFTGAAAALLVVALKETPAPPCPAAPTAIHIQHEMTPLAAPALPPVRPVAILTPSAVDAPPLEIPDGAVRCLEAGRCVIDHGLFLLLRDNPSLLTRQMRLLPSIRDGHVRGIKVYAIRSGSLPRMLGLKNGDLLTAINGVPVTDGHEVISADALLSFLSSRERPVFSLEIERKGEPVRINIDIDWLQEQAVTERGRAK